MSSIANLLEQKKFLLADGAWGTQLQVKGLAPGKCPEEWNLTNRDAIHDVALSYVDAGSDIILTNSFGGSGINLARHDLSDRAYEINRAAATISREAAGPDRIVMGSIGPSGEILMMGNITEDELHRSFREQARALADGGVDAFCIETMIAIDEAAVAIKACKDSADLEIACTFTYEKSADGMFRTPMGHSVQDVIPEIRSLGVDIIGTNCGNGIEAMIEIVKEIRSVEPQLPILVQPNAGIPILDDGKIVYAETPEYMTSRIPDLIKAGATIIGGCCGTTPEHIRAFRDIIDRV